MKKLIGYTLSWTMYWLGDFVSKPMHYLNWAWLYPAYNNLMMWSYDVQEWGGDYGPWKDCNEHQ